MDRLNLPRFVYKTIERDGKTYIFDPQRKKYVCLTPEEWVRQHMIHYLIQYRHYPPGLVSVEAQAGRSSKLGGRQRADILVHNRKGDMRMIVECKASSRALNNATVRQMMRYNKQSVPCIMFTNGQKHFSFLRQPGSPHYTLLSTIPCFDVLT